LFYRLLVRTFCTKKEIIQMGSLILDHSTKKRHFSELTCQGSKIVRSTLEFIRLNNVIQQLHAETVQQDLQPFHVILVIYVRDVG
jgi:hypothetical protein